jgi:hypothetical protein
LEKIWFFGVKSWFFTRNNPTNFTPPSSQRNFFKCAPPPTPLTWNPGSAPGVGRSSSWDKDIFSLSSFNTSSIMPW